MRLTFDPVPHEYRWDGQVVPSVTQILEPISGYGDIPERILRVAAERGSIIHRITELHDYGTLGEYDEQYQPYLDAWKTFLLSTNAEIELVELLMYHDKIKYAGTLDRIIRVKGKRILLDLKSTYKLMPAVGPQTAAYAQVFNHLNPDDPVKERWCVRLVKDGSFDLHKCKDRGDLTIFQSCLNVKLWRMKHE